MARTHFRLRVIYYGMKRRCYKDTCSDYKDYGGRGIAVCTSWLKDINSFISWSLANEYKDDYSLDRTDVNGNYSPENCRWVDANTQAQNRRKPINNTSNYVGISFHKETNKWRASVVNNKKQYWLGVYSTIEEAIITYDTFVVSNGFLNTINRPEKTEEYLSSELAPLLKIPVYKKYLNSNRQYRGITKTRFNTFSAKIWHNRKTVCLGNYSTPEEAARAYDAYVVANGLKRDLNFPEEL